MMTQDQDYAHDVFFSYKHEELTIDWVREVESRLRYYLRNEVGGRDVKIFFAPEEIEAGNPWPDILRDGLKRSRCMVAMWEPVYFHSEWCRIEWESFKARIDLLNGKKISDLVIPMRVHDGDWFPEDAKRIQQEDFRDVTSTFIESFKKTERADKLDTKLRRFSKTVAKSLLNAPPYRPNWPIYGVDVQGNGASDQPESPQIPLVRLHDQRQR